MTFLKTISSKPCPMSDRVLNIDSTKKYRTKWHDQNGITQRDIDVLRLIAFGFTLKEAAAKLDLSKKTVEKHRDHLAEVTGHKGITNLIRFALRHNYVTFDEWLNHPEFAI